MDEKSSETAENSLPKLKFYFIKESILFGVNDFEKLTESALTEYTPEHMRALYDTPKNSYYITDLGKQVLNLIINKSARNTILIDVLKIENARGKKKKTPEDVVHHFYCSVAVY